MLDSPLYAVVMLTACAMISFMVLFQHIILYMYNMYIVRVTLYNAHYTTECEGVIYYGYLYSNRKSAIDIE